MSGGNHEVRKWKWLLSLCGLWFPVLLSGCDEGSPEVDSAERSRIVAVAAPAAAALRQGLVTRLTAAMEEGGPVRAIEFCSTEAIPLTHAIQSGLHEGLTLKRTSFRYRNPANAPDEAEEAALLYFERSLQDMPEPPSFFTQRVSDEEVRYYEPLLVGEFCLQCHGAPDGLDPRVRAVLGEKYPGDLATGYSAGDFRGLIRVSVPATALVQ
jgi:hypothetical protein